MKILWNILTNNKKCPHMSTSDHRKLMSFKCWSWMVYHHLYRNFYILQNIPIVMTLSTWLYIWLFWSNISHNSDSTACIGIAWYFLSRNKICSHQPSILHGFCLLKWEIQFLWLNCRNIDPAEVYWFSFCCHPTQTPALSATDMQITDIQFEEDFQNKWKLCFLITIYLHWYLSIMKL